jgi:hypothetical protein
VMNSPIILSINDVIASDIDGDVLVVRVKNGSNYTVSGTTVTPAAGFIGTLSVAVTAWDGTVESQPFSLSITVTAVNRSPVISAQAHALSTKEDSLIKLSMNDIIASDPDGDSLTLRVKGGGNYSVTGTTVTPAADFNGTLNVSVVVWDGSVESQQFQLSITVLPVNDAPVITAQAHALTTKEDSLIKLSIADVVAGDIDGDTLSLRVKSGSNYTVAGTTVTPTSGFYGTLSVPAVAWDGTVESAPFMLTITVLKINHAPVITAQAHGLTAKEDSLILLSMNDIVANDVDGDPLTLRVKNGSNYTVIGTTVFPTIYFHGTLIVPVTVWDGVVESSPFSLTINVQHVNHAPSITAQAHALSTKEDSLIQLSMNDVVANDVDGDPLTLRVKNGSNYLVTGTTVTPIANFNGTLTVWVAVWDGTVESQQVALTVTVTPVNDPPVISAQAHALSTKEDSLIQLSINDVVASDVDGDPLTLRVKNGSNYTVAGTTVTPVANYNGTLIVPVAAWDGTVESQQFLLSVQVMPVNDAPVITAQAHALNTVEDSIIQLSINDVISYDVDGDPVTLRVKNGNNYSVSGTVVTPTPLYHGTLTVPVTVWDGIAESQVFNLSINVAHVNHTPELQQPDDDSIKVNTAYSLQLIANDVDGDVLTYALVTKPSGMTINATGLIQWTPGNGQKGNKAVTAKVTDPSGAISQKTYNLNVTK